jgi:hypothetical protein
MAEDEVGKSNAKGFAGLAGLVSDITVEPPANAQTTPTSSGKVPSVQPTGPSRTQAPPSSQPPSNRGPEAVPSNQGVPWRVLGAFAPIAVIAVIGAVSQIGKSQDPAPADASTVAADASAAASAPAAPSPAPSTEELVPPVGSGLVLNAAQIRYCLSEKIRVTAVRALVQDEASPDLTAFNAKVDDYNARCSSFQYPSGLLEQVTAEVEQRTSGIETQARNDWIKASPATGIGNPNDAAVPPWAQSTPAPIQAPSPATGPVDEQAPPPESGETMPPTSAAPTSDPNSSSPQTPP